MYISKEKENITKQLKTLSSTHMHTHTHTHICIYTYMLMIRLILEAHLKETQDILVGSFPFILGKYNSQLK